MLKAHCLITEYHFSTSEIYLGNTPHVPCLSRIVNAKAADNTSGKESQQCNLFKSCINMAEALT